jgi:hypothetical protein
MAPPGRPYVVVWASVVLAHVGSLWASVYPPFLDYPNHLARAFILNRYDESAAFREAFVPDWKPTPYLGADLLFEALLSFLDPLDAGRVVLSLSFVLFAVGCGLLGHALHGRATWSSVVAAFVFLNPGLLYGFLNYVLGLGLFFCSAAFFIRVSTGFRPSWHTGLGLTLLSLACYFCHLAAFVLLCVVVAIVLAVRMWRKESLAGAWVLLAPLLPPLAYHAILLAGLHRSQRMPFWGSAVSKLKGLEWLGVSVVPELDVLVAGLLVLIVITSSREGGLRTSRLGLTSSALFAAIYLVFPEWLHGWGMDRRFLVPASVFLIVSLEVSPRRSWRWLAAGALAALLARPLCLAATSVRLSATIAEQVELLRSLPAASRVFPIVFADREMRHFDGLAVRHIVHYATIESEAIVPTLFAGGGSRFQGWVFPLRWRIAPAVDELAPDQMLVQDVPWARIFRYHDFVYAYHLRPAYESVLRRNCRLVGGRGKGLLFGPCEVNPRPPTPPGR